MKRISLHITLLLAATIMMSSCLGDNEDETVYYGDAAITAFTLGKLNRYLHTTTYDGLDSIAKTNIDGTTYKFTIDQINHVIYNTDSLPYGTDISKVICTITSKNSGSVVIKSMTSDSVKYHNSADSVDFSQPRTFIVYSNNGVNAQEYTATVNVHKQQADQFEWQRTAVGSIFRDFRNMRALELNGRMYVVGSTETTASILYTDVSDGQAWHTATPNISTPLTADAYKNTIVHNGKLYMLNGNNIISSADGTAWNEETTTTIRQLLGSDGKLVFAFDGDGNIVSSADNCQTWTANKLDDSNTLLPTQDISLVARPLATNPDIRRVVLVGNRSIGTYPQDANAVVWSRLIENDESAPQYEWMYYGESSSALYKAPRQNNLTVMAYDNGMIAIGGQPAGSCTVAAFSAIYYSADGGITWKKDSRMSLPEGFVSTATTFCATVDSQNHIWLFSPATGEIWRARLSQLGWQDTQTIFRTKKK